MSVADEFRRLYGRAPTVLASAPGRVNLIGEHTDYNGGFVLPTTIPQRTEVAMAPRDDDVVRVVTDARSVARAEVEYRLGDERRADGWLDYVQGCTAMLGGER